MPRSKSRQSSDKQVEVMEPEIVRKLDSSQYHHIATPGEFDFTRPADWPKWKIKFERFRQASELFSKPECQQVSMLVYCLGEEGEDLMGTFDLSEQDKNRYAKVLDCFDTYLGCRKNLVFEWAKFLKRKQQPGESIKSFINDVRKLAESCELGPLKPSLTRDIIVIGVQDNTLSEKLQMDENLTLETAILKTRQAETISKQQAVIRNEMLTKETCVDSVKSAQNCFCCGFSHAFQKPCPARGQKCFKCGAVGHFSKASKKKTAVKEVEENPFAEKSPAVSWALLMYLLVQLKETLIYNGID